MKTIGMTQGGQWMEFCSPSEEQLAELQSATEERRSQIAHALRKPACAADVAVAQALYEKNAIEGADLLACNVMLPAGTGIINCRVDGEHKQIRF